MSMLLFRSYTLFSMHVLNLLTKKVICRCIYIFMTTCVFFFWAKSITTICVILSLMCWIYIIWSLQHCNLYCLTCRWLGLVIPILQDCLQLIIESPIHWQTLLKQSRSSYLLDFPYILVIDLFFSLILLLLFIFSSYVSCVQACWRVGPITRLLPLLHSFPWSRSCLSNSCSFQWFYYIR